jgi:hypothetical protein
MESTQKRGTSKRGARRGSMFPLRAPRIGSPPEPFASPDAVLPADEPQPATSRGRALQGTRAFTIESSHAVLCTHRMRFSVPRRTTVAIDMPRHAGHCATPGQRYKTLLLEKLQRRGGADSGGCAVLDPAAAGRPAAKDPAAEGFPRSAIRMQAERQQRRRP